MEPIVIVEGDDLTLLCEALKDILGDGTSDARPGYLYRLRFAVDEGIKVKANEGVWTLNFGRVEVPARDLCPRCGGDHDRIDRRDPCPGEMRIMLDGVEVGRGVPEGQAPYVFWNRVRFTTPLILRDAVPPRAEPAKGYPGLVDLAPAYRLEPVREGEQS